MVVKFSIYLNRRVFVMFFFFFFFFFFSDFCLGSKGPSFQNVLSVSARFAERIMGICTCVDAHNLMNSSAACLWPLGMSSD